MPLKLFHAIVIATLAMAGCSSNGPMNAGSASAGAQAAQPAAAKPGFYEVKKGDTLYGIALAHGQDYKDIAAWNGLQNPDMLSAGQLLRVKPPEHGRGATKPVEARAPEIFAGVTKDSKPGSKTPAANESGKSAPPTAESPIEAPAAAGKSIMWGWPSRNKLTTTYEDGTNTGLDFEGAVGDPILAAASGKVTLVTNTLRGYGNLVVLKHEGGFVSVYAHASKVLVAEGQMVSRGQKIAEIGTSDSHQPKLHFEIRVDGKPTDPARYLPI